MTKIVMFPVVFAFTTVLVNAEDKFEFSDAPDEELPVRAKTEQDLIEERVLKRLNNKVVFALDPKSDYSLHAMIGEISKQVNKGVKKEDRVYFKVKIDIGEKFLSGDYLMKNDTMLNFLRKICLMSGIRYRLAHHTIILDCADERIERQAKP